VYYVSQFDGEEIVAQEAFVVNLASRDESAVRPNPRPSLPASGSASAGGAGARQLSPFRRELWPYVALAAFIVLLAEWFVAQRITIRRAFLEWRSRRAQRRLGNT
jgi:hypothetical protein